MSTQPDYGFHPVWVTPFYLNLMNANFLRLDEAQRSTLAINIRQSLTTIEDSTLTAMLNDRNWRPQTVAAWFIGFKKSESFITQIGDGLLTHPHHAMHYCFALARIGSPQAADYLEEYLQDYLSTDALDNYSERLSVDWALASLLRLDEERNTRRADYWLKPGGLWETFAIEGIDVLHRKQSYRPVKMRFRTLWQEGWDLQKVNMKLELAVQFALDIGISK